MHWTVFAVTSQEGVSNYLFHFLFIFSLCVDKSWMRVNINPVQFLIITVEPRVLFFSCLDGGDIHVYITQLTCNKNASVIQQVVK